MPTVPQWLKGERRFEPGRVTITAAAQEAIRAAQLKVEALVQRHCMGDFGDIPDSDRQANEMHLLSGGYVTSVYCLSRLPMGLGKEQIWVYSSIRENWTYVCVESEVGDAL